MLQVPPLKGLTTSQGRRLGRESENPGRAHQVLGAILQKGLGVLRDNGIKAVRPRAGDIPLVQFTHEEEHQIHCGAGTLFRGGGGENGLFRRALGFAGLDESKSGSPQGNHEKNGEDGVESPGPLDHALLVELLDPVPHFPHVRGTLAWIEAETLLDEQFPVARDVEPGGPFDFLDGLDQGCDLIAINQLAGIAGGEIRLGLVERRLGVEVAALRPGESPQAGQLAGEELVSDHAKAVDVPAEALAIRGIPGIAQLLGARVERRAHRMHVLGGQSAALPEVADLDVVGNLVGEEDVRGLEVAVDDLVAMQVGHGVRDVADEAPALAVVDVAAEPFQGARLPLPVVVLIGMQAHRIVGRIVEEVEVVQGHDPLVLGHLGKLLQFASHGREVDRPGSEDLQGTLRDPPIGGAEHLTVGSLPERRVVDHVVLDLDGIFLLHGGGAGRLGMAILLGSRFHRPSRAGADSYETTRPGLSARSPRDRPRAGRPGDRWHRPTGRG